MRWGDEETRGQAVQRDILCEAEIQICLDIPCQSGGRFCFKDRDPHSVLALGDQVDDQIINSGI